MYIHCINVCMYKYSSRCKKKTKQKKPPKSNRTHNGKSTFSAKKSSVY